MDAVAEFLSADVAANKIRLYRGISGTVYVRLTEPGESDRPLPIIDRPARCWLARYAYAKDCGVLGDSEIARVFNLLEGWAMNRAIALVDSSDQADLIEKEPVLAVIVEYMSTTHFIERMMYPLWEELWQFASKRKLLRLGRKHFPRGAQVLSRRLGEFRPVLFGLGIDVEIKRTPQGSKVTLRRRLDASSPEPSSEPSGPKSNQCEGFGSSDGRNQIRASLEAIRDQHDRIPEIDE